MPQALMITQETVFLCASKTNQPTADVQAMFEYYRQHGITQYMIFDYRVPGGYAPWLAMSEAQFHRTFRFVYHENPVKFEYIVTI